MYKWIHANLFGRFSSITVSTDDGNHVIEEVWKERNEAESALRSYLSDMPSKFSTPHLRSGWNRPFHSHHLFYARSSG